MVRIVEHLYQAEVIDAHGNHTIVVQATDVVDAALQVQEIEGIPLTFILRVERS